MGRIGMLVSMLTVLAALLLPSAKADDRSKAQPISQAEATRRAQSFFDKEIAIEGALGEPHAKGLHWAFPVKLGYAGTVQRDPILVNRRTGAVSWAGLPAHQRMLQQHFNGTRK